MLSSIRRPAAAIPAVMAALAITALAPAVPASAATPLPCHASMTNSRPADYTTTQVRVQTAGDGKVTTVAHYRTTNHSKTVRAGASGQVAIPYYISGATPGFKVVVTVATFLGSRVGHCSTSFIPHG